MTTQSMPQSAERPLASLARWIVFAVLLLANIAVAAMAFRDQRGYQFLLFVYWAETVAIALLNLPKMLIAGFAPQSQAAVSIEQGMGRLLLLVAGITVYALGFAILAMLSFLAVGMLGFAFRWADSEAMLRLPRAQGDLGEMIVWAMVLVGLSHTISFFVNFIYRREYLTANVWILALQPFARTGLLFAVIVAGALLARMQPEIASTTLFTAFLVVLKISADAYSHLAERRRLTPRARVR